MEFLQRDNDLVKQLYRSDREGPIRFFADEISDGIPLTIDNLVFVCNELSLGRKELEDRTPRIIREKTRQWLQEEKISINMKKDVETGFFL